MTEGQTGMSVRRPTDGVSIIDISGEITGATEPELTAAFTEASTDGVETVVLNFTDLAYMNSSGIGLLVTALIRAQRQNQRLMAYGLTDHYRQIFSLTRLDEAIVIHDDEESALQAA